MKATVNVLTKQIYSVFDNPNLKVLTKQLVTMWPRSKKVDHTNHENVGAFTIEDDDVVEDTNEDTDWSTCEYMLVNILVAKSVNSMINLLAKILLEMFAKSFLINLAKYPSKLFPRSILKMPASNDLQNQPFADVLQNKCC